VASLLDHPREQWRALTAAKAGGWYQGFVLHAHDVVTMLREGTGWEVEYPRDVWRLHTLAGLTRNTGKAPEARNHLRFDRITQPWLRDLAKRWARLRLSGGLTVGTVINDVTAFTRFSAFLGQAMPATDALAGVDRLLLERYLAWLATAPGRARREGGRRHRAGHVLLRDPPARLGRHSPDHRGVLHRRHPAASTAAVAAAQRARHGPDRVSDQPRPLAPPRRPADHLDSDQVRAARLRRVHPGLRLPGPRRAGRPLLRRLQAATKRIHRLEHDNHQLRDALARALGEHRATDIPGRTSSRDTPTDNPAKPPGPR